MNKQFEQLQALSARHATHKLTLAEQHYVCRVISDVSPHKQNFVNALIEHHVKRQLSSPIHITKLPTNLQLLLWTFALQQNQHPASGYRSNEDLLDLPDSAV